MDIRVHSDVSCADGPFGRCTYVIVYPETEEVTHLVVRQQPSPHRECLVPIEQVKDSLPSLISLKCTIAEVMKMPEFRTREFVRSNVPKLGYAPDAFWLWPYTPRGPLLRQDGEALMEVITEHITPDEVAVHQGARVYATDGLIGQLDEFILDDQHDHITHLLLREGHLWGRKDVRIPVATVDHMEENAIYLKVAKELINRLPQLPVPQ